MLLSLDWFMHVAFLGWSGRHYAAHRHQEYGAQQVLALSSDDAQYQQDQVRRLHLPYPMLSDPELSLAAALDLPAFEANGCTLCKRLTLVVDGATIDHVFCPVFPPGSHADEVVNWLRANPVTTT